MVMWVGIYYPEMNPADPAVAGIDEASKTPASKGGSRSGQNLTAPTETVVTWIGLSSFRI